MQGSLLQDHLPEILHSLARCEESGVLQLTRELTSKHIYFGSGTIVFARSNQPSERLGEYLLRKGRITRSQLADASNKLRASGRRLGEVLVSMGVLTEQGVKESVTGQMRGMIRPVFSWGAGEYCFRSQANVIDEQIAVDLPTIPTILDGTRGVEDPDAIRASLGDLQRVVSFSRDPWIHSHQVNLTPQEGFVLSRVDGQVSMADIVSMTPLDETETLRCLYTLVSGGFLEFGAKTRDLTPSKGSAKIYEMRIFLPGSRGVVPESREDAGLTPEEQKLRDDIVRKHASLAGSTLYDCLELPRSPKGSEIRHAYLALVRKYHPDRHATPGLRDLQPLLQEILGKATEAYEALYNPVARRRYDQSMRSEAPRGEAQAAPIESPPEKPPTQAETLAARYHREAKGYLENRDFHRAVGLLEEVVQLDGTKAEYHRTLAQALEQNPKWRKEAEAHYRKAMTLDPFDLQAIVGLGNLYDGLGMKQRAKPLYAMALEIDPDNSELAMKLRRRR